MDVCTCECTCLNGTLSGVSSVNGVLSGSSSVTGTLSTDAQAMPYYDGPYAVIPDETMQILPTRNRAMSDNVTIAPIPNTYGRIAWNGSTLTVY